MSVVLSTDYQSVGVNQAMVTPANMMPIMKAALVLVKQAGDLFRWSVCAKIAARNV